MTLSRLVVLATPVLAAYNGEKALTYAYLCQAASCSYPQMSDTNLLNWQCGPSCKAVPGMSNIFIVNNTADDAFVYGGKITNPRFTRANQCILSFRGTSDISGWMKDLESLTLESLPKKGGIACSHKGKDCQVGAGFLENYLDLAPAIKKNLADIGCDSSQPLAITGHSLGASEAAIAMFDLKQEGYNVAESYTFGQPRTGDPTFAAAFEAAFGSIEPFRVTHANDPIPQVPFESQGFEHISTEVYYKKDTTTGYTVCDGSGEDASCADSRASELVQAGLTCALNKKKCAHLTYMEPKMTILMNNDGCAASTYLNV